MARVAGVAPFDKRNVWGSLQANGRWTDRIFNYKMIHNTDNNIIVFTPLMGPLDYGSSVQNLECLLGKTS